MTRTKKLVIASMLIALQIVLTRTLGIDLSQTQRISFSSVAVVINGALLGPITAGISGGVADIIGFMLKPTGPYFPGFTFSSILAGGIYGYFFYNAKTITWPRVLLANAIISFGINLLLNSFWIHLLYGPPYTKLILSRFPFIFLMFAIDVAIQTVIVSRVIKEARRYLQIRAA